MAKPQQQQLPSLSASDGSNELVPQVSLLQVSGVESNLQGLLLPNLLMPLLASFV